MSGLGLYRLATRLVSPLLPFWLKRRVALGKEDAARQAERFGIASRPRPPGGLLWLHAASIGEAQSALPLIDLLLKQRTDLHLLVTTGTVTSARLMAQKLPLRAFHQYVPLDTPAAVRRFLAHWRPEAALWIESELWPNLIAQARAQGCVLALLNARMSERSFTGWRKAPFFIRPLLQNFSLIAAQSAVDAARYQALGAREAQIPGNLKNDAPPLPDSPSERQRLSRAWEKRPRFMAASTHPGEEEKLAEIFAALQHDHPDLLFCIVPRHPSRGKQIRAQLAARHPDFRIALRSEGESADVQIYIADTLGELGLFYRLFPIAVIGGSLVPHGGQNPLEAARLGCAIAYGPHMQNFAAICAALEKGQAAVPVMDTPALQRQVALWLDDGEAVARQGDRARQTAESLGGVTQRVVEALQPLLAQACGEAEKRDAKRA